jgi:hypothetical protein
MHHQARRLVDDQQMGILEDDARFGCGLRRLCRPLGRICGLDDDGLTFFALRGRFRGSAVKQDRTVAEPSRHLGPASLEYLS